MKQTSKILLIVLMVAAIFFTCVTTASADPVFPTLTFGAADKGDGGTTFDSLHILFLITLLALLPTMLIMMTSFTRIIIVLSFVRNALGLQQTPPNQVLIGLALLLSLFIMSPVIEDINTKAYTPYTQGVITQEEALKKAVVPLRTFMLKQTKNEDLKLFLNLSKDETAKNIDQIKTPVVMAAFVTSELKRAFLIGFMIFIPFLIIDMVVASVLMSMGMMMLPPSMISLPFKILLFVLVDGWGLIVKTLIMSFN